MKASVIIPTFNGAHKIPFLLNALALQSETDFEIIVVVDGSTDGTENVLKSLAGLFANFKIVSQVNKGRAKTRNAGAAVAQTDLFIFYDDDMEVEKNSVRAHIKFHESSAEDAIVTGNQNELPGLSDIQNYKAYLTKFWFSKFQSEITKLDVHNLFFAAATCSMPRRVFEQLEGFDERLTDVEDYDLAYRALERNISVCFDRTNLSIHRERITCVSYIKRLRQYDEAKKILNEIQQISAIVKNRSILKKMMYLPFASSIWVKAIDGQVFTKLPTRFRYRLYDIVIQALATEFPKVKLT